jgi:general stress protein 26
VTQTFRFAEIEKEFLDRVARIVWCTVSTVDTRGRPYARILHPVWEGSTGWIATGRQTLKTKHLAKNPYVALSYWDPQHDTAVVQARAEWCDDAATKSRIWDLIKNSPPPVGYDLSLFWRGGVSDPTFGVLKLTPFQIQLQTGAEMMQGKAARLCRL